MAEYISPETVHGPIVVGVDGSEFSRTALRWAIAEGQRSHSPVAAVLVWRTNPVPRPAIDDAGPGRQELPEIRFQQFLDDTVRDVVTVSGGPVPITRAVPGMAGEVLVDASDEARMLVLGSHGHGRLFTAVVGSVADYCVRNAACPVMIIPALLSEGVRESGRPPLVAPDAFLSRTPRLGTLS